MMGSADPRVLLSGATGKFGRHLLSELLRHDIPTVAMVRATSDDEARCRLRQGLGRRSLPSTVRPLAGTIEHPGLGLSAGSLRSLRRSVTAVLHSAALTSFTAPERHARLVNVEGTRNILGFAAGLPHLHACSLISTAYVAGRRRGPILETELEHATGFLNTYDQTKYEAELLVAQRRDRLPTIVFRPTVILDPDPAARLTGVGLAIRLVATGRLCILPGSPDSRVDMVDAGSAASTVVALTMAPRPGAVYHVARGSDALTVRQILDQLARFEHVEFHTADRFAALLAARIQMKPRMAPLYRELAAFLPHLAYPKTFDTSGLTMALRPLGEQKDGALDAMRAARFERAAIAGPRGSRLPRVREPPAVAADGRGFPPMRVNRRAG